MFADFEVKAPASDNVTSAWFMKLAEADSKSSRSISGHIIDSNFHFGFCNQFDSINYPKRSSTVCVEIKEHDLIALTASWHNTSLLVDWCAARLTYVYCVTKQFRRQTEIKKIKLFLDFLSGAWGEDDEGFLHCDTTQEAPAPY